MLSKNNYKERLRKMDEKHDRFSIRKFAIGAASVLIGSVFFAMSGNQAQAAEKAPADSNERNTSEETENKDKSPLEKSADEAQAQYKAKDVVGNLQGNVGKTYTGKAAQNIVSEAAAKGIPVKNFKGNLTGLEENKVVKRSSSDNFKNMMEDLSQGSSGVSDDKQAKKDNAQGLNNPDNMIATSLAVQNTENVSDWKGFVSALENGNVHVINLNDGFTVDGKQGNLAGQATGYNGCLTLNDTNIAREITINGNGNTIDFGHYSLMFQDNNQKNGSAWDITFNNIKMKGVSKDNAGTTSTTEPGLFGLISFADVSKDNQKKDSVTFNNVTADVKGRPVISGAKAGKNSEYYILNFKGTNNLTNEGYDGGLTPGDDGSAVEAGYVNVLDGTTTINMTKTTNYNLHYGGNAIRAVRPDADGQYSIDIKTGATLNIGTKDQTSGKDVRGLFVSDGISGTVHVGGNLNEYMGSGHSFAIFAGNLDVDKDGSIDIQTQQDQNGDSVLGNTNYDSPQYGVLSIGVGNASDTAKATPTINDNGSIRIIRTTTATTNSKLISMGDGGNYTVAVLNVNPGATLDLQDSVKSTGQYDQGRGHGLISMFGSSGHSTVNFNNPGYVNLQRLNNQTVGSLIYLEGPDNSVNLTGTPIAQWDENNLTDSPDFGWDVTSGKSMNNWGTNADKGFTPAGVNKAQNKLGTDKFLHGNGTIIMAPNQAGKNSFKYDGTSKADGSDTQGVIILGTPTQGATYYTPYLNQLLNHFSYWAPQRLAMGTKLLDMKDSKGNPIIKDANKYEPTVTPVDGRTDQELSDLDAKKGISGLRDSSGQVSTDLSSIQNVSWYDAQTDAGLWNQTMPGQTAPSNPTGKLKLSDTSAWAKVTYKDGSVDFANIPLNIKSQASAYEPKGKDVSTTTGTTPDPHKAISNKSTDKPAGTPKDSLDYLPADATITWDKTPDVSKPGIVPGIVKVTYSDGSVDTVPVNVAVTDTPQSNIPEPTADAKANDPKGKDQDTVIGKVPDANNSITWPEGQPTDKDGKKPTITWATEPNVDTQGAHPGIVEVDYPDGTKDLVPVTVNVTNSPTGKPQIIKQGDLLPDEPSTVIDWTNKGTQPNGTAPEGAKYKWVDRPDITKPGTGTAHVQITYKDGTSTVVPVPVTVVGTNSNYDPYAKDLTLPYDPNGGGVPDPKDVVELPNGQTAPSDVKYTWNVSPDTKKPGLQNASITATYTQPNPYDNTKTETITKDIPVIVNVGPMADYYKPTGTDLTVKKDDSMNDHPASNQISGIPEGVKTTDVWAPEPVTSVVGTQPSMIKVTYADGSYDYVPLNVIVKSQLFQSDKYNAVYKGKSVEEGKSVTIDKPTVKHEDGSDLSSGERVKTTYKATDNTPDWATVNPDGSITINKAPTAGNYNIPVEVDYGDKSNEVAYAPLAVTKNDGSRTTWPSNDVSVTMSTSVDTYHKTSGESGNDPKAATANHIQMISRTSYKTKTPVTITYEYDAATNKYVLKTRGVKDASGEDAPTTISADQITTTWENGFAANTNTSNFKDVDPSKKGYDTETSLASDQYGDPNGVQRTKTGVLAGNSKSRVNITLGPTAQKVFGLNADQDWCNAFANYYGATKNADAAAIIVNGPDDFNQDSDTLKTLVDHTDVDKLTGNQAVKNYTWGTKPTISNGKVIAGGSVRINFNDGTYLDIPVDAAKINYTNEGTQFNAKGHIQYIDSQGKEIYTNPKTIKSNPNEVIPSGLIKDYAESDLKNAKELSGYKLAEEPTNFKVPADANTTDKTFTIKVKVVKSNNGGGNQGGSGDETPQDGLITIKYVDENGNVVGKASISGREGDTTNPSNTITGNVPSGYKIKDDYKVPVSASFSSTIKVPVISTNDNGEPTDKPSKPSKPSKPNKPGNGNGNGNGLGSGANGQGLGNGLGNGTNVQGLGNGSGNGNGNGDNNKALPQTGDKQNNAGIFGLAIAAIAGLLGIAADRKRKN